MKEYEKKLYVNIALIITLVFVIGALLGNIVIPQIQEKEFDMEFTTKKTESIMQLKKPQPIKNFLYEGIISSSNGRFLDDIIEDEESTCEESTYINKEDDVVSTDNHLVKEDTTKKENTTVKESTTKNTVTTDLNTDKETTSKKTETNETTESIEEHTTSQPESEIIKADHYSCSPNDLYYTYPSRQYTSEQRELLAKMLYCEAGGEGWDCQVATCSAIINFIENYGGDFSVLDNANKFSPAPYYRYKTPTKTNYQVLDYVLSGHLIANIKYFRIHYYHSFGTPMFAIDNVYFSK